MRRSITSISIQRRQPLGLTHRCYCCRVNPVPNDQEWCLATGQDFLPNHFLESIDYTSIHMWSDNWGRTDVPFAEGWLEAHMQDAQLINKPLVLEEFGKASGPFSAPLPSPLPVCKLCFRLSI